MFNYLRFSIMKFLPRVIILMAVKENLSFLVDKVMMSSIQALKYFAGNFSLYYIYSLMLLMVGKIKGKRWKGQ